MDSNTISELIKRNENLIRNIASKYFIFGYSNDDLFQEAAFKCTKLINRNNLNLSQPGYLPGVIHNTFKHLSNKIKYKTVMTETGHEELATGVSTKSTMSFVEDFDSKIYMEEIDGILDSMLGEVDAFIFKLKLQGLKIAEITTEVNEEFRVNYSKSRICKVIERNMSDVIKSLRVHGAIDV